jgi:hypothetical protein
MLLVNKFILLVNALNDAVLAKLLVLILRLPVSIVIVKVLLSPFLNVITLDAADAVIRAFGVYDAVAAYEALSELDAYEALRIESNPYGPYTLDELT